MIGRKILNTLNLQKGRFIDALFVYKLAFL